MKKISFVRVVFTKFSIDKVMRLADATSSAKRRRPALSDLFEASLELARAS